LNLDRNTLLAELEKARSELEDAEEMRRFTLGRPAPISAHAS